MRIKAAVIFSLILFFSTYCKGTASLPGQYRFSLVDINQGLSHGHINAIYKDSKGFVWFGTSSGLNRFDGYNIKAFTFNSRDSTSISFDNIRSIFEDPKGNIWVRTYEKTNIFNPVTEKFSRDQKKYLKDYNLPSGDIEHIFKDGDQNFWFVQAEKGMTKFDKVSGKSVNLKHIPGQNNTLSSNEVAAIHQNKEGDFWVIHRNGTIDLLKGQTLRVERSLHFLQNEFGNEKQDYELVVDQDNDLWIYPPSKSVGVFHYRVKEDILNRYHSASENMKLNNNMVNGLVEDNQGLIWVGTDHGGINLIDKKSHSVRYILHHPEVKNSLSHNSIYSLYKDYEGVIWVGTYKNGVNYYHENIIRFPHYEHLASDPNSLPYNDVNAFAEDKNGNLWIGTNGGGLIYMDRRNGKYKKFVHDPQDPKSLSSDVIVSLLIDKDENLWIGTFLGGLLKWDGKRFVKYQHDPAVKTSLPDNSAWELFEDREGNLWVGTMNGGLSLFHPKTETFSHYKTEEGEILLHSNYISAITQDDEGNLWIGGVNGIDVINQKTGYVNHYAYDDSNPGSLISNYIITLYKDTNGQIWAGTTEGLSLYNEQEKKFTHFKQKDGLPHNTIFTILEDDHKNIWVSTPNGISNLNIKREKAPFQDKLLSCFRNYSEADGLQGKVFNENAALRLRSGELVFGGAKGLNIFNPAEFGYNRKKPQMVLSDFELFNKSLPVGDPLLPQSINHTHQITLKHNDNVFSIEFAALNFFHPEKNSYQYKLEGFDNDWLVADKNTRKATYTNLNPGDYEFKVIASNNDLLWNDEPLTMKITVLAPFWKTNVAYVIYLLLFLAALYVTRLIMLNRAFMKFQLEQERREARQLHKLDLMKIRFFTNISHEFKTPLSLILAPIEKLIKHAPSDDHQKQYQMINRNARRLLNLVNQLLDFRKLELDTIDLYLSEGNIIKFIEESVHSFAELSENKSISLTFHSEIEEFHTSFDMDKMEKVLFNLLSNAFKFTPENGKVDVRVGINKELPDIKGYVNLEIKVKDTGIGIPAEKKELIFERFYRNNVPKSFINQGSGIGLSITKEFVKIHGGSIAVESETGKGSCFKINLPLKEVCSLPLLNEETEATEAEVINHFKDKPAVLRSEKKIPHVLIVEDNEDFRSYIRENLEAYFKVSEAKDGKDGWQKALFSMPDLIVSDLMMPVMNGIDFCKKIREDCRTSHIPFILLTARTSEEHKLKGLNIGASDYITKPFSFGILHSRIQNLINQRELLQSAFEKKISVQTSECEIVSLDEKLVQKAMKIVEERISDPNLSVELLSEELNMSRTQLYKKMVSITGKSPLEFIRNIRIHRAAQLLKKSQLNVSEVAYQVGFNDTKYFAKYFKEAFKVPPSQYAIKK